MAEPGPGSFLFAAIFSLTSLIFRNRRLPGTLRNPVQITLGTELAAPESTCWRWGSSWGIHRPNQRLRRQNTGLTARLSEVLGEEVFRTGGIGRTDETETLRTRAGPAGTASARPAPGTRRTNRRPQRCTRSQPRPHGPGQQPTGNPQAPHSARHLSYSRPGNNNH
jgi:hypothetical protein